MASLRPDALGSAPFAFRAVGVAWTRPKDARAVQVRTLGQHGWSPWTELKPDEDDGPDRPVRAATPMLWVGNATAVRVRGADASARVVVIDPGDDPRVPTARARAEPAMPTVVSRAEWGADESLRRRDPDVATQIRFAVVHHTATGNDYGPQDSAAIVRSIYAYHVQANGWDDIGYNALVDRYGRVFEGRHGGLARAVIGAHAQGFNTGSFGVSVIGTFDDAPPPVAAMQALQSVLAWRLDVDHVDPQAKVVVRSRGSPRYPDGTDVTLEPISGHRDAGKTDCPGSALYDRLPTLRDAVAGTGLPKVYRPRVTPAAFTPNGDGLKDAVKVEAAAPGGTTWAMDILDPAGRTVRTFTGTGDAPAATWDPGRASEDGMRHGPYATRVTASDGTGNTTRPVIATVLLADWPDGSLLKGSSSAVYVVAGGTLRHVWSPAELESRYRWAEVALVPDAALAAYPTGSRPGFRDGTLVGAPDGWVWLISGGKRRHIASAEDFNRLGFAWTTIRAVPFDEASFYPVGDEVTANGRHPDGVLVRGSGPEVYLLDAGARRHVPSPAVFDSHFRWDEIVSVRDTELALYPLGQPLGFRDGTLLRVSGDPHVYVVSGRTRRHIPSPEVFDSLAFDWRNIRDVSAAEAALDPEPAPAQPPLAP